MVVGKRVRDVWVKGTTHLFFFFLSFFFLFFSFFLSRLPSKSKKLTYLVSLLITDVINKRLEMQGSCGNIACVRALWIMQYTRFKTEQGATGQGRGFLENQRVNVMVTSLGRMFLTSANILLLLRYSECLDPFPSSSSSSSLSPV